MSLLWMEYNDEFQALPDTVFQIESEALSGYFDRLSPHTRKIIRRDTRYNIDFLYTAWILGDDKVIYDYARWLYILMDSVLKDKAIADKNTEEYVLRHFEFIRKGITTCFSGEQKDSLMHLIDRAEEGVREGARTNTTAVKASSYEKEIREFLDSLLEKNTRKAMYLVQHFTETGIPLDDIYVEILAECLHRIGELWHTARITVDTEHYCTSVTQTAMTQLYPLLFDSDRKEHRILCACPGTELHEIGARMVADIFENDGWDSIYLGAAVPEDALLDAIRTNEPDLVALSVTMPQHLIDCQNLVHSIRQEFPAIKIAVGGNAFLHTDSIWSRWAVDYYTKDARQLLTEANAGLNH